MRALLILFLFAGGALAQIIPPLWQPTGGWDPGVRGGIVDRSTIYTALANGSTRSQIQTALDACPSNQVVKLDAGTNYNLGGTGLRIPNGVTLRGAGISNSVLYNGTIFFESSSNYDDDWNATTAVDLQNCTKGATQVTTTGGAHGYSVDQIILIDHLTNGLADPPQNSVGTLGTMTWGGRPISVGNRNMGQLVRITSIDSSTSFSFDPPLYWAYDRTPQAFRIVNTVRYGGIEELTHLGNSSDDQNVSLEGAINCWMKNVELRGIKKKGVWMYGALWFTITGCSIHDAIPVSTDNGAGYTSDRVYPVFLGAHCTASLITDTIIERCTMGVAFEGCVAGNVFSYNFITNIWWNNTGDSPRRFGPLNHGSHPFMNLIEGNYSSVRFRADGYWGTSSHYTVLRNRIHSTDRGSGDSQCWTMDIEKDQMYNAFLGNCLGGGGGVNEDIFEESLGDASPYDNDGHGVMWRIGALNGGGSASAGQLDKRTWTNQLRWVNWEYRTNDSTSGSGLTYVTNNVIDQSYTTVTNSFYLAAKPDNFGILTWPPFGPSAPANNAATNIPAAHRFYFGTNPPSASGGGGEQGGSNPNPRGAPRIRGLKLKA